MSEETEILISVRRRHTRVALLEGGRLVEVEIERERGLVGSIYKGIVDQTLAGMDSAFVNIGLDRNAFLHVSDVLPQSVRPRRSRRRQDGGKAGGGSGRESHRPSITDLLHKGQEILVQLVKEPIGPKGARVTTRISLPSRYVVLMPVGADYVGVSRRVSQDAERARLRDLAQQAKPKEHGLIVRTEAQGCDLEDIMEDILQLQALWKRIRNRFRRIQGPGLLHQDLSLTERMVRDRFSDRVTRIVTDSRMEHERAVNSLRAIAPKWADRVEFYEDSPPLFEAQGVDDAIRAALKKRVPLPSGGNLQIQETEALVAIDVNTGRFVGRTALADTVLRTNLEAVEEIARHLRLRDMGGIIVLDLIDMSAAAHRRQVLKALREALARDRAKTRVLGFSSLGLVEMTRKRTGESLVQSISIPCRMCDGEGRVRAPWTQAERVEEELIRTHGREKADAYRIRVPLETAYELVGGDESNVQALEEELGVVLAVRVSLDLPWGPFDSAQGRPFEIRPTTRQRIERESRNVSAEQVLAVEPVWHDAPETPVLIASWQGYLMEIKNPDALPEPDSSQVFAKIVEVGRNLATAEIVPEKRRPRKRKR